jgi:group I intron endonuclease
MGWIPSSEISTVGLVYLLTNTRNGKVYVGQTTLSLEERWRQHVKLARSNSLRRQYIHNALRKYGLKVFTKAILATADNQEELDRLEQSHIEQYGSADQTKGYNQSTVGGNGRAGVRISEATREKLKAAWARKKARGYVPPATFTTRGRASWNKGKAWSKETLEKQSEFWTPEHRRERAAQNAERLAIGRCTRWRIGRNKPCICGKHLKQEE